VKTETYDNAEAFLQALHGKSRQKRGRNTRPDLPSAGRSSPTGLTTLIAGKVRTWSTAFVVGRGYRLYVVNEPAYDTGFHSSEKAACDAAKLLS
jgi:hypothetical protein